MISMLKSWKGSLDINGVVYDNIEQATKDFKAGSGAIHIKLYPKDVKRVNEAPARSGTHSNLNTPVYTQYKISVKKYMTEQASSNFDFMAKWNQDKSMPLRTMTGWIEKETKGMVYMHLHGVGEPEIHCMRCGRHLTNPISKKYGIGPECLAKVGFAGIDIEDVDTIKNKLVDITWEGWIIKSAITEQEEIINA